MRLPTQQSAETAPTLLLASKSSARAAPLALLRSGMLWALLALTIAQGLLYGLLTPPWQAPDEPGHFEYAWTMAQVGRIPRPEDASPEFERELLLSLYEHHYGHFIGRPLPASPPERLSDLPPTVFAGQGRTLLWGRFSLGYVPPALMIALAPNADLVTQLYLARLSSVLLTAAIVILAWMTFHTIQPDRPALNALAAALIALIPQHAFINSAVNDATLAELLASLAIYGWVRIFARGADIAAIACVILGTALGLFAKATAYFLVPAGAILATLLLIRRSRRAPWRRLAFGAVGALLLAAALVLLAPIRDRALAAGSPQIYWRDVRGYSLLDGLRVTYESFWATFGWMALPVAAGWYTAIGIVTAAALVGWVAVRGQAPRGPMLVCWITLSTALVAFIVGGLLTQPYYWIQGRYLFAVIVPFAFLLLNGVARLAPGRLRATTATGLVVTVMLFNAWCVVGYIVPYFYG